MNGTLQAGRGDGSTRTSLSSPPAESLSWLTSISIPSRGVSAGSETAGPMALPSVEDRNCTTTMGALDAAGAGTSEGPESLTRLGGGTLCERAMRQYILLVQLKLEILEGDRQSSHAGGEGGGVEEEMKGSGESQRSKLRRRIWTRALRPARALAGHQSARFSLPLCAHSSLLL